MANKRHVKRKGDRLRKIKKPDSKTAKKGHSKLPNMPKDYTFVPKGDVYLTRTCRKLTKTAKRAVFVANDPSEAQGLYCPTDVFHTATALAQETAETRQNAVAARDNRSREDASETILRLFPSIPTQDLEQVLDHGFEKGSRRVGRSTKLPKENRAYLAVQAHIRHVHTPYDALIREAKGPSHKELSERDLEEIRARIWSRCFEILGQWVGVFPMPKPGGSGDLIHPMGSPKSWYDEIFAGARDGNPAQTHAHITMEAAGIWQEYVISGIFPKIFKEGNPYVQRGTAIHSKGVTTLINPPAITTSPAAVTPAPGARPCTRSITRAHKMMNSTWEAFDHGNTSSS